MKRVLAVLVAAGGMGIGLTAGTASADVHGISQAGCGASPNAGATVSHDVENRPGAPIPVTASGFTALTFPGQGGDREAECDVPPGPPVPQTE
jgi:hypothetical protein